MAILTGKQIRERALACLEKEPAGIRYMQLIRTVHDSAPETPINSVRGTVNTLLSSTGDIVRPSRGVWQLKRYADATTETATRVEEVAGTEPKASKLYEVQFYEPFATWLKDEADEVVETFVMGGATLGSKWATPDVIGTDKPRTSDFVKFPIEIVSAEIKIDSSWQTCVTAFGQACAYRLFSHKTYIVVPQSLMEEDKSRLESLCAIYGVGLVLFALDVDAPEFTIRLPAQRFQPDVFYVNEFARRLHDKSRDDFNRLF
jgi:hypothetical protein